MLKNTLHTWLSYWKNVCTLYLLHESINYLFSFSPFAYFLKGALELASAGIGISIFNIVSKIFNIPLLSIATSFVAEDISRSATKHPSSGS